VLSQASANLEFEQNKEMQATAKRPYSRLLKSPEIRQKAIDSPTCICYNTRDRLRNRLRNLSQQNKLWITSKMRAMGGSVPA
jgi:hypothetical protein